MADPQNKVAIKMDDERFLRSKPELRWLVESFVEVRAIILDGRGNNAILDGACMTMCVGLFSPVRRQHMLISPRNRPHKYAAATGDPVGETLRRGSIRARVLHKARAQVSPR
jgi:hypothetical protein